MADRVPQLHAVPPGDFPPPRRRRPGPAVVLVLFYAALFGGGLWLIRPRARAARPRPAPPADRVRGSSAAPGSDSVAARAELLAGLAVPAALRDRYLARIAAEKCDCGCDLPLRKCLARDASCSRSPAIARDIGRALR